jgi:hypothetical protein
MADIPPGWQDAESIFRGAAGIPRDIFRVNAAVHLESERQREVEHAKWRVSAVETILHTHRLRVVRGGEWERDDECLEQRLHAARQELSRLVRKAA